MNISKKIRTKRRIVAAEGDPILEEDEQLDEHLDDMADTIEDIQDTVEDVVEEDDPDIEVENNIEGHFIAECSRCHGVFISPVVESDEIITKVSGECPLCGKESEQELKWIIKKAENII